MISGTRLTRTVNEKKSFVDNQIRHVEQKRDEIHVCKEQMSRMQDKIMAIQNEIQQKKTQIRNLKNRELEEQGGMSASRTVDEEEQDTKNAERSDIINERVEKLLKHNIQDNSLILQEYGMANLGNALITKIEINSVMIRHLRATEDGPPIIKNAPVETFRVDSKTSFLDLRLQACKFWGLDPAEYLVCDENYHNLSTIEENVEMFFNLEESLRSIPKQNVLNLLEMNLSRKNLYFTQRQDVAYGINMDKKKLLQFSKQKRVRDESGVDHEGISRKVFLNFPGLKDWMSKDRKKDDGHLKSWDTHLCTFFFLALILSLSLATMFSRRELSSTYYTSTSLSAQLSDSTTTAAGLNFYQIRTFETVGNYLRENPKFFLDAENQGYSFYMLPRIRIRQLRSKEVSCPNSNIESPSGHCYDSIYSGSSKETKELDVLSKSADSEGKEWWKFRSESDNDFSGSLIGRYAAYDGSGYVWMTEYMSPTDYDAAIQVVLDDPAFLDSSVRAIVLDLVILAPSLDHWIYLASLLEISVTGYINPTFVIGRMFQSDAVSDSLFIIDTVVLILATYMFFLMAVSVLAKRDEARDAHRSIQWYQTISGTNALDFAIWIFFLIQVAFLGMLSTSSEDICSSPTETSFGYDFFSNAENWRLAFEYQGAACALLVLRLCLVLRLNRKLHLLIVTMKYALDFVIHFFLVIVAIIFVFAAVAMVSWGPLEVNFSQFSYSTISILGFTIGAIEEDGILEQHHNFSYVTLVLLSFTSLFFLRAVFVACFLESWRKMVLENGYPENYESETKWQYWDVLRWFFAFLGRERASRWFKGGDDAQDQ